MTTSKHSHTSLLPFSLTQFVASLRTLVSFLFTTLFQCLWLYFPGLQTARPEVVGTGSRAGTQLGVVGVCVCVHGYGCVRVCICVGLYGVCVCVCNWEMEGWKRRRGGPQGWRRRADRRCSDTRRLEELLIFSHVPRGHRCVSAFALFRSLALTNTYTASPLYTQTMTHFTPFQTLSPQKHTLTHPGQKTNPHVAGSVEMSQYWITKHHP